MARKTEFLVTLFGGGGFIGRYVAQDLYRRGARIRVAQPDPRRAFFLKPLGGVGQTQLVRCDIREPEQVAAAVAGADAVVNLVGAFKGNLHRLHVDGARYVAEAAAAAGASALVHVSALGADPESESRYGSTKGQGEQVVREAFPSATIIRPSVVFGMEDKFVNRFAAMARMLPFVPVLRGEARFQPVYVADLGRAIAAAALDSRSHGGKAYEIGGPQVVTLRELNSWICEATNRGSKPVVEIPDALGRIIAAAGGWMPGAPITWDQWLMLQKDNVVSPGAPGLEAFGISPTPLAAVAEGWLTAYRRSGRFAAKSPY